MGEKALPHGQEIGTFEGWSSWKQLLPCSGFPLLGTARMATVYPAGAVGLPESIPFSHPMRNGFF